MNIRFAVALIAAALFAASNPARAEGPLTSDDAFIRQVAEGQTLGQPVQLPLSTELKYVKRSKEYAATIKHVYDLATLELMPKLQRQREDWALVFDVDETVLSNYQYQEAVTTNGCGYQGSTWDAWVKQSAATVIPPAKEFIDRVHAFLRHYPHQAHGTIVFITDRNDGQRDATLLNLRNAGLFQDGDLLLTKKLTPRGTPPDTKDVRRKCVEEGRAGSDERCKGIPPSKILATFGDSFRDHFEYYGADVQGRGGEEFDRCVAAFKCYVIPNPMYGQWDDQGDAGPYEHFKPPVHPQPLPAHCPAR